MRGEAALGWRVEEDDELDCDKVCCWGRDDAGGGGGGGGGRAAAPVFPPVPLILIMPFRSRARVFWNHTWTTRFLRWTSRAISSSILRDGFWSIWYFCMRYSCCSGSMVVRSRFEAALEHDADATIDDDDDICIRFAPTDDWPIWWPDWCWPYWCWWCCFVDMFSFFVTPFLLPINKVLLLIWYSIGRE